mgnify:CR=1 FL=1
MKKIITILMTLVIINSLYTVVFAQAETEETTFQSNASETVIGNISKKEQKIAEYTEKYGGDKVYGQTAYYLGVAQKYSIPICFMGLAIGALYFFIIGNKKLDKKEQGFGMIIAFLLGLVVFQVLPLLFAIIVAGR